VTVTELVTPSNQGAIDAQRQGRLQESNNIPAVAGTDGNFYDVVRVTFPNAREANAQFSQTFDVQVTQRVYVYVAGQRRAAIRQVNIHRITNQGITSTVGQPVFLR
jgi:hypothetical protein